MFIAAACIHVRQLVTDATTIQVPSVAGAAAGWSAATAWRALWWRGWSGQHDWLPLVFPRGSAASQCEVSPTRRRRSAAPPGHWSTHQSPHVTWNDWSAGGGDVMLPVTAGYLSITHRSHISTRTTHSHWSDFTDSIHSISDFLCSSVFVCFTAQCVGLARYMLFCCVSLPVCHTGILCRNNRDHHQAISTELYTGVTRGYQTRSQNIYL